MKVKVTRLELDRKLYDSEIRALRAQLSDPMINMVEKIDIYRRIAEARNGKTRCEYQLSKMSAAE